MPTPADKRKARIPIAQWAHPRADVEVSNAVDGIRVTIMDATPWHRRPGTIAHLTLEEAIELHAKLGNVIRARRA